MGVGVGVGDPLSHGGTWFTEGKAANFVTTSEGSDPPLLLLLGAELQDGPQVEGLGGQWGAVVAGPSTPAYPPPGLLSAEAPCKGPGLESVRGGEPREGCALDAVPPGASPSASVSAAQAGDSHC